MNEVPKADTERGKYKVAQRYSKISKQVFIELRLQKERPPLKNPNK
jgi:hypothetical protein